MTAVLCILFFPSPWLAYLLLDNLQMTYFKGLGPFLTSHSFSLHDLTHHRHFNECLPNLQFGSWLLWAPNPTQVSSFLFSFSAWLSKESCMEHMQNGTCALTACSSSGLPVIVMGPVVPQFCIHRWHVNKSPRFYLLHVCQTWTLLSISTATFSAVLLCVSS